MKLGLIGMVGGTLFVLPFFVFGYDDTTTHRALTQEIISFFNSSYPEYEISRSDGEEIIQGSEDEDSGTRWLYHFFDPAHNRGLVLETEAPYKDPELAYIGAAADLKKEWESSKEWAQNTLLQGNREDSLFAGVFTTLFSDNDDYSWERAIYDYSWVDKKRGLRGLGHILHLLEDKTVPDHTRNDAHPPILDLGSPYEYWTKKFNRTTIRVPTLGARPIELAHIGDYFDSLSKYSHNNFFSKDTISTIKYSDPKIIEEKYQRLNDGRYYLFGHGKDPNTSELFPLVQIIKKEYLSEELTTYSLRDTDDLVLNGYWMRLSKQAVLHGAGAMKLFFDEVAEEKKTRALYDKNRSWMGKKIDSLAGMLFGYYEDAPVPLADSPVPPAPPPQPEVTITEPILQPKPQTLGAETEDPAVPPAPPKSPTGDTSPSLPIAGVGGAPPKPGTLVLPEGTSPEGGETGTSTATSSPTVIAPPRIIEPSARTTVFATTTIIFSGTAEPGRILIETITGATTTADGAGAWILAITSLARGTTTLLFFAKDNEGNMSTGTAREVFVDPQGPDISLTIENCARSLSPELCLIPDTMLALAWAFGDEAASTALECDVIHAALTEPCGDFNPDTGTTTYIYEAQDQNALYRFRARAQDETGNETIVQKDVRIQTLTVVINEIAWPGTGSSASTSEDQWIELFNQTEYPIALDGITLISLTDGTPEIPLSGVIGPRSYYLIERTDDNVISNVPADLIADFSDGLTDDGEVLALVRDGIPIDRTPNPCKLWGWCFGIDTSSHHASMERMDPFEPGDDEKNWYSWTNIFHKTFYSTGRNREGEELQSTPRIRNSANAIIRPENIMTQSKTLRIENSPYVVRQFLLTIDEDATLTIPKGITVKFWPETHIEILGKLIIEGSETDPVIITSIFDDEYGGDLNEDGASTSPRTGDWCGIRLWDEGSSVKHAIVRYGGLGGFCAGYSSNIMVYDTKTAITDSIIERSASAGVRFTESEGTFERNIIRDNKGAGANIENSTIFIGGNTFSGNGSGINISSVSDLYLTTITDNIFRKNTGAAITASNAKMEASGNIAEENGKNGIEFSGFLTSSATLSQSLPYIVLSYQIAESGSLTIPAGVIMKFDLGSVFTADGALTVAGSAESPVIFTSIRDDEFGGDTNGDATSTSAAPGDWSRIHIRGPGSAIAHSRIRFGGASGPAALTVENTELTISHTAIEKNLYGGVSLANASSSISHSVISDHAIPEGSGTAGLRLASSTAAISETLFRKNNTGIAADLFSFITSGGGILFEENGADTIPPGILP